MKKYVKGAMGLTTMGIGLGAMAGAGGNGVTIGKISSGISHMGGIMGSAMVVESFGGLQKQAKRLRQ